ncbi:YceI family protein [Dyadobacter tibetensis]|uniref:YceI family protein n=1 Tax=Dyadobacter tibetensis TaxID=1211851 RepID=UPI00046F3658|nr:YceI family protein [Dyadobacter tibetensis]
MRNTKWVVDPAHSEVQFKIKHLVISTITGSFKNFKGGATSDMGDFENAEIHFSLDVNSIDTNQSMRDAHLKSADFFDAEQFPHIEFRSNYFHKINDEQYKLNGYLTLKGITKPIELDAEFGGTEIDEQGKRRAGFEVVGRFGRQEFGLNYLKLTESGRLVIGEDVKLLANIQLIQEEEKF